MDLRTLFINFHHLLNEYRPHQARESLILMMQDQLDRSKAETEAMLKMKAEVEEILEGLGSLGIGEKHGNENNGMVDGEGKAEVVEDGRDTWEELEREFS
jgi:mediator of RNA polymerase II transcription subunit 7